MYMADKLIISNTDNYNQDFEFSDTKTYVGRYVELINEYMLYVVENMIIQDDAYLLFLIQFEGKVLIWCCNDFAAKDTMCVVRGGCVVVVWL